MTKIEHKDCLCEHDHCECEHDHCECEHDHCECEHDHQTKQPVCSGPAFNPQPAEKGVSLGADVEKEVAQAMKARYKRFLAPDEIFSVKTEVCHQFGMISVHVENPKHTTNIDVEVSIDCEENMIDNPIEAYQKALDVIDTVLLEYFESDRISHYLPIWQTYQLDDTTANVRLEHSNKALDDEASAFLLAHGFTDGGLLLDDEDSLYDVEPSVDEDDE